jgi:hypothetical protein
MVEESSQNIENYNPTRLYKIKYTDSPDAFTPGRNAEGEQSLVGKLKDDKMLVALFFSPQGEYLRYVLNAIVKAPDPNSSEAVGYQEALIFQEARECFIHELKMTCCDIQIRHFEIPEWRIGISDWMGSDFARAQEAMARVQEELALGISIDDIDDEDKEILEWQQNKNWVMYWNQEFGMSDDGEVIYS